MNETVRVNAAMSKELVERIDEYARRNYEDRSTAIRQLVDFALRERALQEALSAYETGRLTIRELARSLGIDIWQAHDILAANGVATAQGDATETRPAVQDLIAALRRDA
ncbi:MAG: ribbon-helix-helix protein, CopG family [Actinobacteria bacterium ATB1]|nr:ribbon-helix-helix protein, CopG family [Actinobacteria bacterium ATB1]